jgi:2-amino-4-hydroxy-6-hydroxymethyldihydropteridine diphosphokinase / dihydropteroate synthase
LEPIWQAARLGVPYVVMHMRGDPTTMQLPENLRYSDLLGEVAAELQAAANEAMAAGVEAWRLILDPGNVTFVALGFCCRVYCNGVLF